MPGLDGTGPSGEGPLTGRKRGRCTERNIKRRDRSSDLNGSGIKLTLRKHGKGQTGNRANRRKGNKGDQGTGSRNGRATPEFGPSPGG